MPRSTYHVLDTIHPTVYRSVPVPASICPFQSLARQHRLRPRTQNRVRAADAQTPRVDRRHAQTRTMVSNERDDVPCAGVTNVELSRMVYWLMVAGINRESTRVHISPGPTEIVLLPWYIFLLDSLLKDYCVGCTFWTFIMRRGVFARDVKGVTEVCAYTHFVGNTCRHLEVRDVHTQTCRRRGCGGI